MKLESPAERIESIRRQAEGDLKDHRVTPIASDGPVKCWKCSQLGTWMYGFFVTTIPGFVFIAGDIGELVLHPTHPDPEDFILQGDPHYQYGKAVEEFRQKREVSPYLVRQELADQVKYYRDEGKPLPDGLKELCRDMREAGYEPESIDEFYSRLMDIDVGVFEVSITVPAWGVIYRLCALQWFGRWLAEQRGVKAA